jgi:hypothetical protein
MAITLTTDPIVAIEDVKLILGENDNTRAALILNSVSAKFLRFTNRLRILSGSVTEYVRGEDTAQISLHATPVTAIASIDIYDSGLSQITLASSAYTYYGTDGVVQRFGEPWPAPSDDERNIKVAYTGGWTAGSLPGDIVAAALELMRWERQKLDGLVGMESRSAGGQSAQFEVASVVKAVEQAWAPWRIWK